PGAVTTVPTQEGTPRASPARQGTAHIVFLVRSTSDTPRASRQRRPARLGGTVRLLRRRGVRHVEDAVLRHTTGAHRFPPRPGRTPPTGVNTTAPGHRG